MKFSYLLIAAVVLTLTACKSSSSPSTNPSPATASPASSSIVQKVEAAGAGDLSGTSESAIEQWMKNHPDFAQQIQTDCGPVQANAKASWYDSTEGRVCQAARAASHSGHMGIPMGPMSHP